MSNKRPTISPSLEIEDNHRSPQTLTTHLDQPPFKRSKPNALQRAAPLAKRVRPQALNDIFGQDLIDLIDILRDLIQFNRVPSMIL